MFYLFLVRITLIRQLIVIKIILLWFFFEILFNEKTDHKTCKSIFPTMRKK